MGHAAQTVGLEAAADQCHSLAAAFHAKSAQALRLKIALQTVYGAARLHDNPERASADRRGGLGWSRRSRLNSFKKLVATIKDRFEALPSGIVDHCSNAYVEAMNGLLRRANGPRRQQAKRAKPVAEKVVRTHAEAHFQSG